MELVGSEGGSVQSIWVPVLGLVSLVVGVVLFLRAQSHRLVSGEKSVSFKPIWLMQEDYDRRGRLYIWLGIILIVLGTIPSALITLFFQS